MLCALSDLLQGCLLLKLQATQLTYAELSRFISLYMVIEIFLGGDFGTDREKFKCNLNVITWRHGLIAARFGHLKQRDDAKKSGPSQAAGTENVFVSQYHTIALNLRLQLYNPPSCTIHPARIQPTVNYSKYDIHSTLSTIKHHVSAATPEHHGSHVTFLQSCALVLRWTSHQWQLIRRVRRVRFCRITRGSSLPMKNTGRDP